MTDVFFPDTKLVAGVRLQNVAPEMEQVFDQLRSYLHASPSGPGRSGPGEAAVLPSPHRLKTNQRSKSCRWPGHLGAGVSAPPPRCQLPSAAAAPPTKPAAQKLQGPCGGNKARAETPPLEDSLNCAELKNTLTPKKDLLSALQNLSSDDWYALNATILNSS